MKAFISIGAALAVFSLLPDLPISRTTIFLVTIGLVSLVLIQGKPGVR